MFTKIRHGKRQVDGFYIRFLRTDFYRLLLNLVVFALLGFLIWWSINLFTQYYFFNPLTDSLIFVAGIIVFVFLCVHIKVNSWRPPKIWITAVGVIILFLIFAFAGVQPFTHYKDVSLNWFSDLSIASSINDGNAQAVTTTPTAPTSTLIQTELDDYHPISSVVVFDDVMKTINDARIAKNYQPIELTQDLNDISIEWNTKIAKGLANNERIVWPSEIYRTSVFIIERKSTNIDKLSVKDIANIWISDKRELVRLTYPSLRTAGIGIVRYQSCIICTFITSKYDVNDADAEYWKLWPNYYSIE